MTRKLPFIFVLVLTAISGARAAPAAYVWERLTEAAPYPPSYNFPVHVAPDGRFVALHSEGTWTSRDGKTWAKAPLPWSGTNAAYLAHVQHDGATWALGKLKGDYLDFRIDPVVQRTRTYDKWEQVGASSSLPHVVFYAAASFNGALWIMGGFDGKQAIREVWRSDDGMVWTRVVERAPWSARSGAKAVIFRQRLYLIGGGMIDAPPANDVWSSADGIAWRRETASIAPEKPTATPFVFDGKIWLIGANRSGAFTREMLVSDDGKTFRAQTAPWSPRGGVVPWTDGRDLYLTGGKYSHEKNGEHTFVYSNDVWRMRRK